MININDKEVKDKNTLIDNAIAVLKKEFVGIDQQIEAIMENVRTWFLFPILQERPLTINLWGMSGCGKTALVKRLSQLLEIESDFVYFNFAKIDEMSSWEVESELEENLSNTKSNRMFVYDEFQYAATIDEYGKEKPKKSALKPFWELLDNGLLHQKIAAYKISSLYNLYKHLSNIDNRHPIKLNNNGEWINSKECLMSFNDIEIEFLKEYFNFDCNDNASNDNEAKPLPVPEDECCSNSRIIEHNTFFIKGFYTDLIYNCLYKMGKEQIRSEFMAKFTRKNVFSIKEEIFLLCKELSKGYDLNFKNSIIFVIGNLDEAYTMSFNVDPDMSPDQFHALTKRLTIVDIKEALQKRFRNEQIARLGNIHIIYPSFSSKTFKGIIDYDIKKYCDIVKEKIGYDIVCDNKIKDLIYKEGVFPTHGTRPVFSTIQEIIKSKLPLVIKKCYQDNIIADKIVYSYKYGKTYATLYNKNKMLAHYSFQENLRVENLRNSKKDNNQALSAVHESGHFVMYIYLKNKLPKTVRSVVSSSNKGGFLLHDIEDNIAYSSRDILDEIMIALGGYVAELIIFGKENLTSGSVADLKKATTIASRYVRDYAMGNNVYVTTYIQDSLNTDNGGLINENNQDYINKEIKDVINRCFVDVKKILNEGKWKKVLINSSKFLSENSSLSMKKMKELYSMAREIDQLGRNENYYKNIVKNL